MYVPSSTPSILVTGCGNLMRSCRTIKLLKPLYNILGFPDIATRALVARVASALPHVPVLGICDYNPFGVALLQTYKVILAVASCLCHFSAC